MITRAPLAAVLAAVLSLLAPASASAVSDISVTLSADPTAIPRGGPETTTVTLTAKNDGPDATEVSGTATVGAPQLEFTGFKSISQGVGIFSSGSEPPITVNFGSIAPQGTATLVFVLNDAQFGVGIVKANVTHSGTDPDPADNETSAAIKVFALEAAPAPLQFGSQVLGGIGAARTLTITNRATVPVQVSNLKTVAGGDFLISSDGCSGTTLAAAGTCEVSARFAPSALGERSGTMTVASSTAEGPSLEVLLRGTGAAVPPVDASGAVLKLTGVPKSISAERFKKGFSVKVTPDEAVTLHVELLGKARAGALASAFDLWLFRRSLPAAAGTRTIKVKPKAKLIRRLVRKIKVQLNFTATDGAGNRSTATRKITVKPPARP